MTNRLIPAAIMTSLLAGCCIAPTEPATGSAPPADAPSLPGPPAAAPMVASDQAVLAATGPNPAPATGVSSAAAAAAVAAPALATPAAPAAKAGPPPAAAAPVAVGALLAGGSQYAYEDVGISLTVPSGWSQQLMTGGVVALFSGDYPTKGKRDRGALILVSNFKGPVPTDDAKLKGVLKEGLDPAATIEAGPIRLPIADKQGAQIVAKGVDDDGAKYQVLHTILQSGNKAVSVKSMAFDNLDTRKPVFDAVMESISFTGKGSGR